MGTPAIGSVVRVDFPYSNFSKLKKRPALIIGLADFNNLIICQITSKKSPGKYVVSLSDKDFRTGGLFRISYIRSDKLLTIDPKVVDRILGTITGAKLEAVKLKLKTLLDIE